MNLPHNIFVFEVDLTLYVFLAYGDFSFVEFNDFIDTASLRHIPDKVAVYYHEDVLIDADLPKIKEPLRSRFRCDPIFFKFDRNGKFGSDDELIQSFIRNGKSEIIRLREPVLYPPPGKSFMKPSGTKESFFIQASNLFVRHAEMSFIALLLIREWGDKLNENVKVIYVDTIDLYGLTSLASRMRFGDAERRPITVSFSSYDRFEEVLKHADVQSSLMVISATTSHNLLRDITVKTTWKETDRVVTILGLDPAIHHEVKSVLKPKVIAHVKPKNAELHINHLPAIRLAGEKFTIEVDEPKSVVLKKLTHGRCLSSLKLKKLMQMTNVLSACVTVEGSMLPVSVGRNEMMSDSLFRDWLKKQIEKYAPISTSHVVLMEVAVGQVEPLLEVFGSKQPAPLTPNELRNPSLHIEGSVIVICPTFSTGSKLLEVSRDLRKQRTLKNVIYFTGIGTPESRADFEKLRKNLETDGFRLLSFCNVATGSPRSLALSWKTERDFIRQEDDLNQVAALQERAKTLETGKLNDGNLFYRVEDLELHDGFKYWEGVEYGFKDKPSILMFTTFAFLLQDARTNLDLAEEDRLAQLPNRRVLLDPENFFRYNDSLIQASILRAAFPVEIDYSDHEDHSRSMLYLFRRAEQVRNRSLTYEILLALATSRLRITPENLLAVKKIVVASNMEECQWFADTSFFKSKILNGKGVANFRIRE